jgi:hypothetical protein
MDQKKHELVTSLIDIRTKMCCFLYTDLCFWTLKLKTRIDGLHFTFDKDMLDSENCKIPVKNTENMFYRCENKVNEECISCHQYFLKFHL